MSAQAIPMLRRMPLGSRVGWMVAAVLCTLIELMDVVGMLAKPDDFAMLQGLSAWPDARARVSLLLAETGQSYWLMRANTILLALIAGLIAGRFATGMSRSLRELRAAAQRVSDGDFETQVSVAGAFEVGRLSRAIDRMRLSLREGLRLARENAALREDVALSQAAGALLTPKARTEGDAERILGFHALTGSKVGFWWHTPAARGRRTLVLGYVEGAGPASVISLAALAGAVRDELLHVRDVDLQSLVKRSYALCSQLSPLGMALVAITLDETSGRAHWVSAGRASLDLLQKGTCETLALEGPLCTGSCTLEERLTVVLGPCHAERSQARERVLSELSKLEPSSEPLGELLQAKDAPAAVIVFERDRKIGTRAA